MQASEYMEKSSRTVTTKAFYDNVASWEAFWVMNNFIAEAGELDQIKKSIFYNRAYPGDAEVTEYTGPRLCDAAPMDVFHGILGVATESAELVELLVPGAGPIDRAKVIDECGDVLFYVAMILRRLGVSLEEAFDLNIGKLMVRFPEKFDENLANHRSDEKERAVFSGQ